MSIFLIVQVYLKLIAFYDLRVHYDKAKSNQAWFVKDIVSHEYNRSEKRYVYKVKWASYTGAEEFEE